MNKKYNPNLLIKGFAEGCYSVDDNYELINENKSDEKETNVTGIEKKIEDEQTEKMIKFAGIFG